MKCIIGLGGMDAPVGDDASSTVNQHKSAGKIQKSEIKASNFI